MIRRIALVTLLACAGAVAAQDPPLPVDLELVLAVDTSRSMDYDELRLQREGYAQALEHPAVTSALNMGRLGRSAIMYFEWGGEGRHRVLVDWTLITSPEDAAALAAGLRRQPLLAQRGTSISSAMAQAARWIETNGYDGARKVIDVSGDGPNNRGRPVLEVRDEVAALGIEVNGLPFMIKEPSGAYSIPDLDIYYENCVITGDRAFVIPIYEIDRLVVSIRQKLVLEISGRPPPPRLRRSSATDCLIGEKMRRQPLFTP
ncbi:DUF1194 domain-containing protein [Rhodobacteraceae bacterium 2CG4]|uniref:DUF1194 domain-containing protein n=1 Tax=Halovulum marinum TaxID=2662447 RepID=A0A6L5YZ14_9RHOB|nr:DUF1194 domain-containing protein [Halovulum marinum]MSU89561.1 DUF1194 domain-containing protein [Halovulum marinum]